MPASDKNIARSRVVWWTPHFQGSPWQGRKSAFAARGTVAMCEERQKEEGDRKMLATITKKIRNNWFLFEELVKRDFKQKYKRTVLGMAWSVLSPLLTLLVMSLVFTRFFGRTVED